MSSKISNGLKLHSGRGSRNDRNEHQLSRLVYLHMCGVDASCMHGGAELVLGILPNWCDPDHEMRLCSVPKHLTAALQLGTIGHPHQPQPQRSPATSLQHTFTETTYSSLYHSIPSAHTNNTLIWLPVIYITKHGSPFRLLAQEGRQQAQTAHRRGDRSRFPRVVPECHCLYVNNASCLANILKIQR